MENKQVSLNLNYKFENIEVINNEFTKVKIRVQGVGKNRNMSYMDKENIKKNLPTLSYCPVVGHLIEKEDGTVYMGGHDEELILTEQGIQFKSLTVPFGVVCKDSFDWEDVQEYGSVITYLTAEAFLWTKRYSNILESIYSKDVWFGQSMELSVSQYRPYSEDSNYTELLDWNYSALCLLGKSDDKNSEEHTEPCFISSTVKPFEFSINKEFNIQMEEIKEQLAFYFDNLNKNTNGGEKMTEEIIKGILEKYNIIDDSIVICEITDEMTAEEFETKVKEFADLQIENSIENNVNEISPSEQFAITYREKRQSLENACDGSVERNENGDIVKSTSYWVQDFDDTFVYVEQYICNENDNESTVGRFAYSLDEESLISTLTSEFEKMIVKWLTIDESNEIDILRDSFTVLQQDFDSYKEKYSVLNTEVEELEKFKSSIIAEGHKTEVENILSDFADLKEIEEFKTLSEKAIEFQNIEDLRKECYAIRGKNLKVNFAKNSNTPPKAPLHNFSFDEVDDGFGGLLTNAYKNK